MVGKRSCERPFDRLGEKAALSGNLAMLTHTQIWAGVDGLAARHGMTASGLARKAGLDPTTFNRSKRIAPDGRQRWPSTESIAKVLEATGASLTEFLELVCGVARKADRSLRRIDFAQIGRSDLFDAKGHLQGTAWGEFVLPDLTDENAYALEISGDSFRPVYRDGDIIVVSPAAPARGGDRVILRTMRRETLLAELRHRTAKTVELQPFDPRRSSDTLAVEEVVWIARILWASQ
jgi:phage repressor protein C with HTH and peptisase S24 domain